MFHDARFHRRLGRRAWWPAMGIRPRRRGRFGSNSWELAGNEPDVLVLDFTAASGRGEVSVRDRTTPANNRRRARLDEWLSNAGTSPKLVRQPGGTYAWSPHNLFLNSGVPATQNVTLITGATYTVTVTGSGSLAGTSGASGTATDGSPVTFVATGTTGTFTLTGSLTTIQINRGSVATRHIETAGAAKYAVPFDYIDGWAAVCEPAATNVVLWSRDLTNAAWTKSNTTAAKDQTGVDGAANQASSLTATSGNGTCLQITTVASSARWHSAFVKRLVGTGTVEMTMDNGSTWTPITLTSSWQRLSIATQTLANPTAGFRIVTSGDSIAVDFVQNEAGVLTSPISTFGATVTRALDDVTALLASFPWDASEGSGYAMFQPSVVGDASHGIVDVGANGRLLYINNSNDYLRIFDGTAVLSTGATLAAGVTHQGSSSYGALGKRVSLNGAAANTGTFDGTMNATSTVMKFGNLAGVSLNGRLKKVVYVPRQVPDADLPTWRYAA